jgi:hypothetical protein
MSLKFSRLWLSLTVLLALLSPSQAQLTELPEDLKQEIETIETPWSHERVLDLELETPWTEEGVLDLKLESDEASSAVRKVRLDMKLESAGWRARLSGKGDLRNGDSTLSVSTSKSVGDRLRAIAEWEHENGASQLRGKLECSLFGRDHWKAARTVQLSGPEPGSTTLETSLAIDMTARTTVELGGLQEGQRKEVSGGLMCKPWEGLSTGAVWKAQVEELSDGQRNYKLGQPTLEGRLRWQW